MTLVWTWFLFFYVYVFRLLCITIALPIIIFIYKVKLSKLPIKYVQCDNPTYCAVNINLLNKISYK